MGDGDDFKGCARPSKPGRGRQARSLDRFEDIHIVRLSQHGCSPRLDTCIAARVRNVLTAGRTIFLHKSKAMTLVLSLLKDSVIEVVET